MTKKENTKDEGCKSEVVIIEKEEEIKIAEDEEQE